MQASDRRSTAPRRARPKPPRDAEADTLLRLCREGRLFELQDWAAEGKSLAVTRGYRQTPLRVAIGTGFHSLIEFLLQHGVDQSEKNDLLKESCWRGQPALMQLAMKYGASVSAVSFQDVIEMWDREIAQIFLGYGADPVTNAPFARAFKQRVKAALGIFLDCRRARPDLADALQKQADAALRQACQDDDLKWVSLLMWLGADPRAKGLTTDDLDTPCAHDDPLYQQSALQIACGSQKPEILRRLKPDPDRDDLHELMAAASAFSPTPETVAYLVSLGADINDRPDGTSTGLDACLRRFGWRESVLEAPFPSFTHVVVPLSGLARSLNALRSLLAGGARWAPDGRSISEVRRALYRLHGEAVSVVVDLLRTSGACHEAVLKDLVRTPKMRELLAAARRQVDDRGSKPTSRARART